MILNFNRFNRSAFKQDPFHDSQSATKVDTEEPFHNFIAKPLIPKIKEEKDKSQGTPDNRSQLIKVRKELKNRFQKDKEIEYDLSDKQKQFFIPLLDEVKPIKDVLLRSVKQEEVIKSENVLSDYLKSITDRSTAAYSLKYNQNSNTYSLGDSALRFSNDQIILKDKVYNITSGIMELLTKKSPNVRLCTQTDFNNYKEMLILTNALYYEFDPKSKKFNTDKSEKFNLIRTTLLPNLFKHKPKAKKQSQSTTVNPR